MSEATRETTPGRSGGQFSLARIALGGCLLVLFADRLVESGTLGEFLLLAGPTLLAVAVAFGALTRWTSFALALLWAIAHFFRGAMTTDRFILLVLLILVATSRVPPYLSFDARGRTDPAGGWRLAELWPPILWAIALGTALRLGLDEWDEPGFRDGTALGLLIEARPESILRSVLLAVPAALWSGATWIVLAVHFLVLPLALVPRSRPLAWWTLLGVTLLHTLATGDGAAGASRTLVLLFLFDPAWIRPRPLADGPEVLFYDGNCGLCHRTVRFLLAEDQAAAFRFAPLHEETFLRVLSEEQRRDLPDSLVLLTEDGRVLTRSDAVVRLLLRLGGCWTLLGGILRAIPRSARNAGYDLVAAIRLRLFPRPQNACPLMPPHLAGRFDP
jgi:predicted DCC family thiol-disulfide oxidoreductase YuxK